MGARQWSALVPELTCTDLDASLTFYCEIVGFELLFARPEERFAYLQLGCAQLMLEQGGEDWRTGPLERPFGRGLNLQIEVSDARSLADRVMRRDVRLFRECRTAWYREGTIEHGQVEFLVQDPDGYLLRFIEPVGERPAASES